MSLLLPQELIEYLSTTVSQLFKIDKSRAISELKDSSKVLDSFISDPSKQYIFIRNQGQIIVHTVFENCGGPVLFVHKNAEKLLKFSFLSVLTIIPLASDNILPVMQSIVGRLFLPSFQNSTKDEDILQNDVLDSLTTSNITMTRCQSTTRFPEPVLDISEEFLTKENNLNNLTPEQESQILTAIENWQVQSSSIIKYGENPPEFDNLQEELGFWPLISSRIETVRDHVSKLKNSNLLEIIKKHRKSFPKSFENTEKAVSKLFDEKVPFSKTLSNFQLNIFDKVTSLEQLNECIVDSTSFLVDLFDETKNEFRSVQLFSLYNKEIMKNCTNIISKMNLLSLSFQEFNDKEAIIRDTISLWNAQNEEIVNKLNKSNFAHSIKEENINSKKSNEKIMFFLNQLKEIISDYHELSEQLNLHPEVASTEHKTKIKMAFDLLAEHAVLDLSKEGSYKWAISVNEYHKTLGQIETQVSQVISTMISNIKNIIDMQKIFKDLNVLVRRQTIQSFLCQHQYSFISQITEQLTNIQKKDLVNITKQNLVTYLLNKGTTVDGARLIIVNRAASKVEKLKGMLNDVIGERWIYTNDCQDIVNLINTIENEIKRMKDPSRLMDQFRNISDSVGTVLFDIDRKQDKMLLTCKYSPTVANTLSTFRTAKQMGVAMDMEVTAKNEMMLERYTRYIKLSEALGSWNEIISHLEPELYRISPEYLDNIYGFVSEGWEKTWSASNLNDYISNFGRAIMEFKTSLTKARETNKKINVLLDNIKATEEPDVIKESLAEILTFVDQLFCSTKFKNQEIYVNELNERIAKILSEKMNTTFTTWDEKLASNQPVGDRDVITIKLTITSSQIHINPPVNQIHPMLIKMFSDDMNNYLLQTQIYTMTAKTQPLFQEMINVQQNNVHSIFEHLTRISTNVQKYVNEWRGLQYFFTTEPTTINFEENIGDWISFLTELVRLYQKYKKSPTIQSFGAVEVDASKLQPIIISRLTEWNKEIAKALHNHASDQISKMQNEVNDAKAITKKPIPVNARDLAPYLKKFKEAGAHKKEWEQVIPQIERAAKLCKLDDFGPFKESYDEFIKLYDVKKQEIEINKQSLCVKVDNETASMAKNISILQGKWESVRPINGALIPEKAIGTITKFETAFIKIKTAWEQISAAREALGLQIAVSSVLDGMIDDCGMMKDVWNHLSTIYTKYTFIFGQPFATFVPAEFKGKIISLSEKLAAMPENIRNYEAWNYYAAKMKSIIKIYPILEGLKSPAILPRHWSLIGAHFKKQMDIEKITLQQVYDLDLESNAVFISEIMRNAQGEFSLYQYLEQLNMTWNTFEFEFSTYKGRYQLIKSWDNIMTTISDQLNFLGTMQTSPFFHVFREQATNWTTRLNTLQVLLDEWLDVQRRFVYLEGVFNSADIRNLLAKASLNFKKNEKEFVKITKQAIQLKLVIKISTISNIDQTLTALNNNLLQLQKELSDYLEKQRSYFPRFFFIGDEDLLEIIGKSSQINEIQKHFGKMFEGLAGVVQEDTNITEMTCSEGEHVKLSQPVSTTSAVYKMLSDLEGEMRNSLCKQLLVASEEFNKFWLNMSLDSLKEFIEKYPSQITLLSFYIVSTLVTEKAIQCRTVNDATNEVISFINLLSQLVFTDLSVISRHSIQQLITECVHQRNLLREINDIESVNDFEWTRFLRFYVNNQNNTIETRIGDASFLYGFEYLGMCPSLVRTPLTDRVYLTLAQALYAKLGGSPFGPAGTGKTETVKNMGHHLGRHVLVFNCDETFDFKAMGRIFVGLCHCGSWGCFDEFNRLDEQMLSAVSQQIQTIQVGLKSNLPNIQILGRTTPLHQNIGIFITMNPGYAGRVELPDNLKQLFRTMAMNKPDTELITEVLLFSQGFASAEQLAPKFVALFSMAKEALSNQTHYDFGLRAMKSVLTNAGQLIRMNNAKNNSAATIEVESKLLISSIVNTLFPKLLANDLTKLKQLIDDVFPGVSPEEINQEELLKLLREESEKAGWVPSEVWINKIIQLYYIQQINHGFMLVGPSATGKTSARTILLKVLSLIDKQESESYVINPKSVTKDTLFGCLDPVTREWTDGVFTRILRTIVNDQRGEMSKRHWIVFDGDVDPEWVENLNSVLDDNKLLTLPNGERISLPPNVRIVFEVANLNYATPATVSRCGIVFFSNNTLKTSEIVKYNIHALVSEPIITQNHLLTSEYIDISLADMLEKQKDFTDQISNAIYSVVSECETFCSKNEEKAVMRIPIASCISTFFALIRASFINCLRSTDNEIILKQSVIFSAFWAFGAQFNPELRKELDETLRNKFTEFSPAGSLLHHYISFEEKQWINVENIVPVKGSDGYVATPETEVERNVVNMSLIGGKTIVLCGDKGVGKRALFNSSLSQYADVETINVNLSNCSSIDFVLQTLEQFTIYVKSSTSLKMRPKSGGSFLIFIFNDLNLPSLDKYGTQRVVEFLRQIIEMNGFWHPQRREWIQLELISFAGMCSPPTAYGRVKLSERFLRHSNVIYSQPQSTKSLHSIVCGLLKGEASESAKKCTLNKEDVASCICDFYNDFKERFRASELTHYITSLKDIVSWINSFLFAISSSQGADQAHLLFYEGLRVFTDRLQTNEEKYTTQEMLQNNIIKAFSDMNGFDSSIFEKQIVYTRIVDKNHKYTLQEKDKVIKTLQKKMKDYCDENISNELVFFDEAVEEYCRIERRLSEPGGHMLLVGQSGTGKIQMTNFAAWCLEIPVFRLRIHKEYTVQDFDADIRKILKACLDSNVCLIVKDTDLFLPIFTERLNVLLSQNNIPGLFQGDEYNNLIAQAKDTARMSGAHVENDDAIFQFFIDKVTTNLHFVYVSNSATVDMNKVDIMFPSLFEKCNISWIGTWSEESLAFFVKSTLNDNELEASDKLIQAILDIHRNSIQTSESLAVSNYVSPRYFFSFIEQYCKIFKQKRQTLQAEKEHLSQGLSKLNQTQEEVKKMGTELATKKQILKEAELKAEQKLEEIIKDKEKTKQKQSEAEKIKLQLDEKTKIIDADKSKAQKELDAVGPMIEEASKSVQNIKKSNLDEIRRLTSPPDVIKNTLSCVLLLLGQSVLNWASIRKIISSDSFIKSIVDFKINTEITANIKKVRELISATDLTYDKADRASKACGPLFKWLDANIKYLQIVDQTEPLRKRVASLEKEADDLQKQHENANTKIKALERSLKRITLEYQQLNSQCDQTRKEAELVQIKLDRAQHLLLSLTSETKRWTERNAAFQTDFDNLIGHSVLSAAFVAYCGFLEQQRRVDALIGWESILSDNEIKYNEEFQFTDFMCSPGLLIDWSKKELPKDDLCIQNATILDSQNNISNSRVPLIVDPAGQATTFLLNTYDKIVKTSFVDPKFPKHLESCLRFGTTLLVEDGEQMDQLVLPVLNHEFKKAGGRVLLDLKRTEIDISPAFKMFIVTRDTDFVPEPSIASLTLLVNFSVTSLSLRAQCMTRLLKVKLPDIESRRQELHQSLATMQVSLSSLEDKMLNVFSETKGEILENDELLHLLEHIKEESTQIEQKAKETRATLQEITETSEQFSPVAEVATNLYFALRDMGAVHFLYQFSLNFFWSIFDKTVELDCSAEELIEQMAKNLFVSCSYSILNRHLTVLGFRFSQILLEHKGIEVEDSLYDLALRGSSMGTREPSFMKEICSSASDNAEINEWISRDAPEQDIPEAIVKILQINPDRAEHPSIIALKVLAVMRRVRQDRIVSAANEFIRKAFGYDVLDIPAMDLLSISEECSNKVPILLCAAPGHDPSDRVEACAEIAKSSIESVAVGAADSYGMIEETVSAAAQKGSWVIVKNVHLAPYWIRTFIKTVASMDSQPQFRVFFTSEINPKVGSNVFRSSRVIAIESATGIKANLRRISASGFAWTGQEAVPEERRKIVVNFLWLHAIIMERLRFTPLGWCKLYEFNDSDIRFAMQVGLRWLEKAAEGKTSFAQEQFPWTALNFLVSKSVYGGRVDIPSDQRSLSALSSLMLRPNATIGEEKLGVKEPTNVNSAETFKEWIETLPNNESPEILYLPKNSGKFLFIQQGNETMQQILSVSAGTGLGTNESKKTSFIKALLEQWNEKLESLEVASFNPDENNLMASVIKDEITSLAYTRQTMINDIQAIRDTMLNGDALSQKDLKIIDDLNKGTIPNTWNKHQFFCSDLQGWIEDFMNRIQELNNCANSANLSREKMSIGFLKSPETFIAASKQTAARINKWPIEKMRIKLIMASKNISQQSDICLNGLTLLASKWSTEEGRLVPSDEIINDCPPLVISWTVEGSDEDKHSITVPFFMTQSKKRVVAEGILPVSKDHSIEWWTVRNPGIVIQKNAL